MRRWTGHLGALRWMSAAGAALKTSVLHRFTAFLVAFRALFAVGRRWARFGVDSASCCRHGQQLVALLPGQPAVAHAPLQRPEGESLPWRLAQAPGLEAAVKRCLGHGLSVARPSGS